MPSHFHSAMKSAGVEIGKIRILDRMRQHHRAERRGVAIDRLVGAAFQPGEQIEIGRRQPRPHQLDVVRVLVAERRRRGLGQPRRNPDPHRAGDELEQRPAAGLVELVEPARELCRQFGLAERAKVVTTSVRVGGGGLLWPGTVAAFGHISATVSDRSPT